MNDSKSVQQPRETKQKPNITQRIAAARRNVEGYIQKDTRVKGPGGEYPAVTHDAVTAHIRKAFIDAGVLTSFDVTQHHREQITYGRHNTTAFFTTLEVNVHFVSEDDKKDVVTVKSMGAATDSADKGIGKAISYAVKYAELKLMNLETGEDEESRTAEPPTSRRISEEQQSELLEGLDSIGQTLDGIEATFGKWHPGEKWEGIHQFTVAEWNILMSKIAKKKELANA